MMWGYYNNGLCGGGFWPWSIVGGLLNVLLIVFVVVLIVRLARRGFRNGGQSWWNSAEATLKERFAKGEISKEEYEEKLKVIRG